MVTKIKKISGLLICVAVSLVAEQFLEANGFFPGRWLAEGWVRMNIPIPEEAFNLTLVILAALSLYYSEVRLEWLESISRKIPSIPKDLNLLEALEWWEKKTGKDKNQNGLEFFDHLLRKARSGEIFIFGRRLPVHQDVSRFFEPLEKINPDHWRNHKLDPLLYINAEEYATKQGDFSKEEIVKIKILIVRNAKSQPIGDDQERYLDLQVNKKELERLKWPVENT